MAICVITLRSPVPLWRGKYTESIVWGRGKKIAFLVLTELNCDKRQVSQHQCFRNHWETCIFIHINKGWYERTFIIYTIKVWYFLGIFWMMQNSSLHLHYLVYYTPHVYLHKQWEIRIHLCIRRSMLQHVRAIYCIHCYLSCCRAAVPVKEKGIAASAYARVSQALKPTLSCLHRKQTACLPPAQLSLGPGPHAGVVNSSEAN